MAKKFLIVDDAPFIRDIVANFLESQLQIQEIEMAENGQEALEKFQSFQPDFIFMDIVMPLVSGIEATKQIRALNKEIPIVGLSTLDHGDVIQRMLDAGANHFVQKPFNFDDLKKAIEEHS